MKIFKTTSRLLLTVAVLAAGRLMAEGKYHLKPGAQGELCLGCHEDFTDQLKKPFVHTPVKGGECTGCHSPHAADHGKLLTAEGGDVCRQCHAAVAPDTSQSIHQVVGEGKCDACHDPHAAEHANNLRQPGQELCLSCHTELAKTVSTLKFPHAPVSDDCQSCHSPHASANAPNLLNSPPTTLCGECHDTTDKKFAAAHRDYPVATSDCTTCHNPHGSNRKGILYDQVHEPVAKGECTQCHEAADSPNPFATKRAGFELCQGCHNSMVKESFDRNHVHSPLVAGDACLNCHAPHAATQPALLKGASLSGLCGQCHADTLRRQDQSKVPHPPMAEGECSTCHDPHASDQPLLAADESIVASCNTCHDWREHSSHPIGEEHMDMRNPNLAIDCLSCHRAHGTEFDHMMPFPTITELCVQCHEQFKR